MKNWTEYDATNPNHLRERADAYEARPGPVEVMDGLGTWRPWVESVVGFNNRDRYRRAPKPVTRPWWKPADVPGPVCWMRGVGEDTCGMMVIGLHPYGVEGLVFNARVVDRLEWKHLHRWEHSTDRVNWFPCVITEPLSAAMKAAKGEA